MPAKVKKNSKGGYSVSTPSMTHAKNTTKDKAEAQARLLNAIDHGFVPSKSRKRKYRNRRPTGLYSA
jgi:hypothetical protein